MRNKIGEACETDIRTRETGQPLGSDIPFPICFVLAHRIDEEFSSYLNSDRKDKTISGSVLAVIEQDRECDRFCAWRPGFSPKEHSQMMAEQLLRDSIQKREDADKEWRQAQDEKRREYEARQKEAERKWQQEQKQDDRKWHQEQEASRRAFQVKLSIGIAILSIITGLLGVILGAYLRS